MEAFNDVSVEDYLIAGYQGANDVTFGGSAQWSANVTAVDGASNETGTTSGKE